MRPQLSPKRREAGLDTFKPQANAIARLIKSSLVLEPASKGEFVLGLPRGQALA
jgi:hypothetical protein